MQLRNPSSISSIPNGYGHQLPPPVPSSASARTPPLGKSLIAAEIAITAADQMTLFVNGERIGSGTPPNRGAFVGRFCVDLVPSFNVFAVSSHTNAPSGGGMIGTILLTYSDNTTDTIVSDASWCVQGAPPAGFEQLEFDDTAWSAGTVVGAAGDAPWGPLHIASDPPVLGLQATQWVWTDVGQTATDLLPAGSRAFRRIFTPAPNQTPMNANILISANNEYTLYVNGVVVGTGANPQVAQHYVVEFQPGTEEVVLAVLATNTGSEASTAGVLVVMEVNMLPVGRVGCIGGAFALTDVTWKSTTGSIPAGWEQPGFNDTAWSAVFVEANYGTPKFGNLTIAAVSPTVTV
ncbi:hypothetical protein FB45DRAFT_360293 [Roridomyces roridus]|uniref:Lectin n=1 Tax=Roridomyces roridus TaxID=1738132 RepID=A0AAD7C853_9AGAR|nr:hypothetical protein FB45DRAFT_360293 [Roridomyces roridus]